MTYEMLVEKNNKEKESCKIMYGLGPIGRLKFKQAGVHLVKTKQGLIIDSSNGNIISNLNYIFDLYYNYPHKYIKILVCYVMKLLY